MKRYPLDRDEFLDRLRWLFDWLRRVHAVTLSETTYAKSRGIYP